ncbi:MAG: ABC transporter permease, partial [Maritimibacter harenae]
MNWGWLIFALAFWAGTYFLNVRIANSRWSRTRVARIGVPVIFGITILVVWQGIVRGLDVPMVILPAPTDIWLRMIESVPTLWEDFVQTFVKGALTGYVIGCGAAVITAILIDRSPFL